MSVTGMKYYSVVIFWCNCLTLTKVLNVSAQVVKRSTNQVSDAQVFWYHCVDPIQGIAHSVEEYRICQVRANMHMARHRIFQKGGVQATRWHTNFQALQPLEE